MEALKVIAAGLEIKVADACSHVLKHRTGTSTALC